MALTEFQRGICRLIAATRKEGRLSYVAGGVALNSLAGAARVSRDIDIFHDAAEAVLTSWQADRDCLVQHGYGVEAQRQREAFVEAVVTKDRQRVVLQWTVDSAFRFFPLVENADFGLVLHPFDLATNKVLALVGRLEARDWVDVIECCEKIQPLGYLAWAASGKDPGFSPAAILEQAGRSARYSAGEISILSFDGPPPDAADLSRRWHTMLDEARRVVSLLPPDETGRCVCDRHDGGLVQSNSDGLAKRLKAGNMFYHAGQLRGAWPQVCG